MAPLKKPDVYRQDAKCAKGFKIKAKILYILALKDEYP
jgi:hypothetical protein